MSQSQKTFYETLKFLSSIPSTPQFDTRSLTEAELYQSCQYLEPYMLDNDKYNLSHRLQQYRDRETGDTCLHIAAKASNKKLLLYLLEKNQGSANRVNNRDQNALFSVLEHNLDAKAEQIGYILAKFTDLSHRNAEGKRAFEVSQAKMDPLRARLLEHLKDKALSK